jgi:hypothetical protein
MQRNAQEDRKMSSNKTERVKVDGGFVEFDWDTGDMRAQWDNGQTETWTRKGASIDAKASSFFAFTDQWERYAVAQ